MKGPAGLTFVQQMGGHAKTPQIVDFLPNTPAIIPPYLWMVIDQNASYLLPSALPGDDGLSRIQQKSVFAQKLVHKADERFRREIP